jgi:hypothetical protein
MLAEIAIRWSGILLIGGAALLGLAIVTISLKPVMGQPLSPGASLLLLLSSSGLAYRCETSLRPHRSPRPVRSDDQKKGDN